MRCTWGCGPFKTCVVLNWDDKRPISLTCVNCYFNNEGYACPLQSAVVISSDKEVDLSQSSIADATLPCQSTHVRKEGGKNTWNQTGSIRIPSQNSPGDFSDMDRAVCWTRIYGSNSEWLTLLGLAGWWLDGYIFEGHRFKGNENETTIGAWKTALRLQSPDHGLKVMGA